MKKAIAIVLCFVILFSTCLPVASAETLASPRYTYVFEVDAYYDLDSYLGIVYCEGNCVSHFGMRIKVWLRLERYDEELNKWTEIASWEHEGYGAASASGRRAISAGHQYRVMTVGYAYDSNGVVVEHVYTTKEFYY